MRRYIPHDDHSMLKNAVLDLYSFWPLIVLMVLLCHLVGSIPQQRHWDAPFPIICAALDLWRYPPLHSKATLMDS